MKVLVRFALKKRFASGITIVFNLLLAAAIMALFFADRLGGISTAVIDTVCLDTSTSSLADRFSRFDHQEYRYKVSSQPADDSSVILHFDDGWTIYSQQPVDEPILALIKDDIQTVITEKYLQQADLKEASFINDYRSQLAGITTVQPAATGQDYLWLIISVVYFLILGYGSAIAADVVYEKSTHSLEVILTAVSAREHFKAKIVTGYAALLIQSGLGTLDVLTAFLLRYRYDKLAGLSQLAGSLLADYGLADISGLALRPLNVILALALILLGVLTIQIILLVAASQLVNEEQASALSGPLYIVLLLGYYLLVLYSQVSFMDSPAGIVLSQLPLTSMLVMPVRLLLCDSPLWQGATALAVGLGFLAVLVRISLPLYQRGILNYQSGR